MRLCNKVAVVTGGSRGIGRAISIGLAREGAAVAVNYVHNEAAARDVAAQIRDQGGDGTCIRADTSDAWQVQQLVDETLRKYGRIDILVNNAGIAERCDFLSVTEELWDRLLAVNTKGVFLVSQAVARHMAENGNGKIINITSQSGFKVNLPSIVPYCVSKAATNMLTRAMAVDLAPHGIRVNAVAPGIIQTDLTAGVLSQPAERAKRLDSVPLGRPGRPEEIVGAVVYLASDESDFVTGSVIVVDGGYLA